MVKQGWALGTTYIRMLQGYADLTDLVDVYTSRILANWVVISMQAVNSVDILKVAITRFGVTETVDSYQDSQYTVQKSVKIILNSGSKLSIDGRRAWRDNVFVERVCRSIEKECVYLKGYESFSQARSDFVR